MRSRREMWKFILLFLSFCEVASGQWAPEIRLTRDDSFPSTPHSSSGWAIGTFNDTVHIIWIDGRHMSNDYNFEVYYKRSTDAGSNWSQDIRLTNTVEYDEQPSIAVSGFNVYVAWDEYVYPDYSTSEVWFRRSTDGGTSWDSVIPLTNAPFWQGSPCVAVSDSIVHVVWDDYRHNNNDKNYEIYYRHSTDYGVSWEPEIRLTNSIGSSVFPSVWASGLFVHVVWYDEGDSIDYPPDIYYCRSTDGGKSWESVRRMTRAPWSSVYPKVVSQGDSVHIMWFDFRNLTGYCIYYKNSTDNGLTWSQDREIVNDSTRQASPLSFAIDGSFIHAVWQRRFREVYYVVSRDGGRSWQNKEKIMSDSPDTTWVRDPSIGVWGSRVHVVCGEYKEGREGHWEVYYKSGIPLGVERESSELKVESEKLNLEVFPNPATSVANLRLQISDYKSSNLSIFQSSISIKIYDVTGRLVRQIPLTLKTDTEVNWDLRDDSGKKVSAGVYFVRLEIASPSSRNDKVEWKTQTKRVVVIR